MLAVANHVMVRFPAVFTIVIQTVFIAAKKERTIVAFEAFGVLQIRIDLNLYKSKFIFMQKY